MTEPSVAGRSSRRILVVGADGFVGHALSHHLVEHGHEVYRTSRRIRKVQDAERRLPCDLAEDPSAFAIPEGIELAYVCAGVTTYAVCEANLDYSNLVNVTNSRLLIDRLVAKGVFVVYPSSSIVFDGGEAFPGIDATRQPTSAYGKQKKEVEDALAGRDGTAVVRLTKVIDSHMPLLEQWYDQATEGRSICCFSDFALSPISIDFVVSVLTEIGLGGHAGTWHLSARGDIMYGALAQRFFSEVGLDPALIDCTAASGRTDLSKAYRAHSAMDCRRAEELLGREMPDPWAALLGVFEAYRQRHLALKEGCA